MSGLTSSEIILYAGIAIMIMAAVLAIISIVVLKISGTRLRKKLQREYGQPYRK